jgi:phytoene/squalene synthetase
VHPLLDPPAPSRDGALRAIHLHLAETLARWAWARRLLGRELADGLGVVLAWHLLSRQLLAVGADELPLRRSRDELLSTLREAEAGTARSAMAVALAWVIPRFGLSLLAMRGRVEALERDAHVMAFASRAEIRAMQSKTAHPEALALLAVLGLDGEREQLLAQSIANGFERAVSLGKGRELLESKGRLVFSAEELAEARVNAWALVAQDGGEGVALLFQRAIHEARAELAKGWPLCHSLGHWRGRQLGFVLRWFSAELSGLEVAEMSGKARPAKGGKMRLWACAASTLGPRESPY